MNGDHIWLIVGYAFIILGSAGGFALLKEKDLHAGIIACALGVFGILIVQYNNSVPNGTALTDQDLPDESRWERVEKPTAFEIRDLDSGARKLIKSDTDLKRFQVKVEWNWNSEKPMTFRYNKLTPIEE